MGIERDRFARRRGDVAVHGRGAVIPMSTVVHLNPVPLTTQPTASTEPSLPAAPRPTAPILAAPRQPHPVLQPRSATAAPVVPTAVPQVPRAAPSVVPSRPQARIAQSSVPVVKPTVTSVQRPVAPAVAPVMPAAQQVPQMQSIPTRSKPVSPKLSPQDRRVLPDGNREPELPQWKPVVATVPTVVRPSQPQETLLDDEEGYSAFANYLQQEEAAPASHAPKSHRHKSDRSSKVRHAHPVLKGFAKAFAVLALFSLSIGAGAYSTRREGGESANNTQQKVASATQTASSANTDTGVLGISTADTGNTGISGSSNATNQLSPNGAYYQISDTFEGSSVTISRQPLPDQYKKDPQALQKFADQIHATQTLQTNNWGTVYMLTNPNGAQALVFKDATRLIFIQSSKSHSAASWVGYIDAIGPKLNKNS